MAYDPNPRPRTMWDMRRAPNALARDYSSPWAAAFGVPGAGRAFAPPATPQATTPPNHPEPAVPPSRRRGNILDALLGLTGVGLSDDEVGAMRRNGLLTAGATLLRGGASLPEAILSGQQGAVGALAQRDQLAQRRSAESARGILDDGVTPESLRTAFGALMRAGRTEEANALVSMYRAMEPSEGRWHYARRDDGVMEIYNGSQRVAEVGQAAAADVAGLPAAAREPAMQFQARFQNYVTPYTTAATQYALMDRALDELENAQPGQLVAGSAVTMLYGFLKSLDPTGAVREGELSLLSNAGGPWRRLMDEFARLESGNYSRETLRSMREAAADLNDVYREAYDRADRRFRQQWTGVFGLPGERLPLGESPFIPSVRRSSTRQPQPQPEPTIRPRVPGAAPHRID